MENSQELISHALNQIKEGIIITDAKEQILALNYAVTAITGYDENEILGQTPRLFSSGAQDKEFYQTMWQSLHSSGYWQGEVMNRRKDGTTYPEWLTINALKDHSGVITHFVGVLLEISERKSWEQALKFQAYHDPLTCLPNRRFLEQRLRQAIARAKRQGTIMALGLLDLDDFKLINDQFGHETGDQLLQAFCQRVNATIREEDFLARLGGDEFVLVFELLDPQSYPDNLIQIFDRLHQVIETPFTLGDNPPFEVSMSMGVATFPKDADDGDSLLRQADARLYQIKNQKSKRSQWWEWEPVMVEQEAPMPNGLFFDPYGQEARELLEKLRHLWSASAETFVDAFFATIAHDSGFAPIIARYPAQDLAAYRTFQKGHLHLLFDPATTKAQLIAMAQQIGIQSALMGIDSLMVVRLVTWYRQWFSEQLNMTAMRSNTRYRLWSLMDLRLQDELLTRLQTQEETIGQYQHFLLTDAPVLSTWQETIEQELLALGSLPGLLGVLLFRLDKNDTFTVEASSGPEAVEISFILKNSATQTVLDPSSPRGNGAVARAWRSQQIVTIESYMTDPGYQFWWKLVNPLGLRSSLAIPILDERHRPVAVVALYGVQLGQFESVAMQQFAHHLQHRWNHTWMMTRHLAPLQALSQELSSHYRTHLLTGGLTMYVQPLIDISSGKLAMVEALARLSLTNGDVLSPAVFLPLLEQDELHLLFQQGLDQALRALQEWETQDISVSLSINVAPSTLIHPDFSEWVTQALTRYQVMPARLTLEVLENEAYDQDTFYTAIHTLNRLGVALSMDDLGSGYSSLERLSSRYFDLIKIDQSLLFRIRQDPLAILSLIDLLVQLGESLALDVVVEGVEAPDVLEAMMMLNAKFVQGYQLARPMPITQLPAWLSEFQLPVRNGEIHTYLGALAYHLTSFKKRGMRAAKTTLADCPLTRFLDEQGLSSSDPANWHAQIHAGHDIHAFSQQLVEWLVEQVRTEHQ